jgi:hypothetical protein
MLARERNDMTTTVVFNIYHPINLIAWSYRSFL